MTEATQGMFLGMLIFLLIWSAAMYIQYKLMRRKSKAKRLAGLLKRGWTYEKGVLSPPVIRGRIECQ